MASKSVSGDVRGFTLIEIAIVLVVIGLLLSGGLLAIAPVIEQSRTTDTEGKMDRIEAAIVLYTIQNSCLPCPANGATATGAANDGESEDSAAAFYTTGCAATNACRADGGDNIVPWTTLGLSESDIVDGWGNRIYYDIDDTLSGANDMDRTGGAPPVYPTGSLTVGDISDVADPSDNVTTEAAYVLFSFGPDGSDAYASQSGAQRADRFGSADQNENSDGSTDGYVQDTPVDIEDNTYFDDIVRWKSAPIIVYECGESACGNP